MAHLFDSARTRRFAFLATIAVAWSVPLPMHAQTAPTNLVARETILLRTTTPLGEATIALAPGTALTNYEIQGDRVKVWQGPFAAVVDLAGLQPPAPEATPSPTPEPTVENTPAPTPAATAEPEPTMTPMPGAPPLSWNAVAQLGPSWLLPAVAGALALYALFATVALVRARRRTAGKLPEPGTPVITMPRSGAAKPAVVSEDGQAIACPLCGAHIPREKLHAGRNHCPSCRGRFVCE